MIELAVALVIGIFLGTVLTYLACRSKLKEGVKREDLLKSNYAYLEDHAATLASGIKDFFQNNGQSAGTALQDAARRGVPKSGAQG